MRTTVALIRRAASMLLAVLLGLLLGISAHAATAAVAVDAAPPSLAYNYVGDHKPVALTFPITERGPPTYTGGTALDAVDRRSRGASARSAEPTPGDAINHDTPAAPAQSARTAGMTTEQAQRSGGPLRAVHRLQVAAESAPSLKSLASEIREAGLHPAARNNRTFAVGVDAEGNLFAGSSNGFDAGQRAAFERLGITRVPGSGSLHAEEELLRGVPGLQRVGTSVRSPCGASEHNCLLQLIERGVGIE